VKFAFKFVGRSYKVLLRGNIQPEFY